MPNGSLCTDEKYEINSKAECETAADSLGILFEYDTFLAQWMNEGQNEFPACVYLGTSTFQVNSIYFNPNPNPSSTKKFTTKEYNVYSAICHVGGKNNYL